MGQLGKTALGWAGYALGGPLGGLLGSYVGSVLFPVQRGNVPAVAGLKFSIPQKGVALPVLYGTRRIPGNYIWYGNFQIHKGASSKGGKGGPSAEQPGVTTYSASFALALCEGTPNAGRLQLRRIYAGDKLIWSYDGSVGAGLNFTFYDGTQTAADSHIASVVAAANASGATSPLNSESVTISNLTTTNYTVLHPPIAAGTTKVSYTNAAAGFIQYMAQVGSNPGTGQFSVNEVTGALVIGPASIPSPTATVAYQQSLVGAAVTTPQVALVYPFVSYVMFPNYDLGASHAPPNFHFELFHAIGSLYNDNFESGSIGWTPGDTAWAILNDATNALSSTWCAQRTTVTSASAFNNGPTGSPTASSYYPCVAGEEVYLEGWMKSPGANGTGYVRVQWYDVNKTLLSTVTGTVLTAPQTAYQKSSLNAVAPTSTAYAQFSFYVTGHTTGTWYADNMAGGLGDVVVPAAVRDFMQHSRYGFGDPNPKYALSFDGVSGQTSMGNVWGFAGTVPFTVECWLNFTAYAPGYAGAISKMTAAGDGWQFVIGPSTVYFERRTSLGGVGVTFESGSAVLGVWHHLAFTYDGSNQRAYLDGVLVGGPNLDSTVLASTTASLLFGKAGNVGFGNCLLDEVRIWNIVRTQAQIQATMNTQLSGGEPGLVGYWKFTEGTGVILKDATVNANNGTLNGGVQWSTSIPVAFVNPASAGVDPTSYSTVFDYVQSTDLRVSPLLETSQTGLKHLEEMLTGYDGMLLPTQGIVKFDVRRVQGTSTIRGLGDFTQAQQPQVSRQGLRDSKNRVLIEHLDRSNLYQLSYAKVDDDVNIQATGERILQTSIPAITRNSVAQKLASQAFLTHSARKVGISHGLDPQWGLSEASDLYSVVDGNLGLSATVFRIVALVEDPDWGLRVQAIEEPLGYLTVAPVYKQQAPGPYVTPPGPIATATSTGYVLENPTGMPGPQYSLAIFATGLGTGWAGTDVYVSRDGAQYFYYTTLQHPGMSGILTANLSNTATTGSVDTTESNAQLTSTSAGGFAANQNLLVVGAIASAGAGTTAASGVEYMGYLNATLLSTNLYRLDTFKRGLYKTTAPASWAYGTHFVQFDPRVAAFFALMPEDVGRTLYFRFDTRARYGAQFVTVASTYLQYAPGGVAFRQMVAPVAPIGLSATVGTGKLVQLNWTANTELDFFEYLVYRNTTNTFATATLIANVRVTQFLDANVTNGTTYYYWIVAKNFTGNTSGPSAAVSATTAAIGSGDVNTTPPLALTGLAIASSSTYLAADGTALASVTLSWTNPTDSSRAFINVLSRKSGGTDWVVAGQTTGTSLSINDLSVGIAYDYAVEAVSNFGIFSTQTTLLSQTSPNYATAPAIPIGLTAALGTGKLIQLNWTANTEKNLAGYLVWRNTVNNSATATQIATVTVTQFVDAGGAYGTTFFYWIKAYDFSGNVSGFSLTASATPFTLVGADIGAGQITATQIAAAAVDATKLNTKIIVLLNDVWTDNSPSAGFVAWSGAQVVYQGTIYTITNSNTNLKYIYWQQGTLNTTFQSSATFPTLGDNDFMIAINNAGTHDISWHDGHARQYIDSVLIADAAILTAKIANLAVTTAKIANLAVTNAQINDLVADKITGGLINVLVGLGAAGTPSISLDGANRLITITDQASVARIRIGKVA